MSSTKKESLVMLSSNMKRLLKEIQKMLETTLTYHHVLLSSWTSMRPKDMLKKDLSLSHWMLRHCSNKDNVSRVLRSTTRQLRLLKRFSSLSHKMLMLRECCSRPMLRLDKRWMAWVMRRDKREPCLTLRYRL